MKKVFYYPMKTGLVEIIAEDETIIGVSIRSQVNENLHLEETPVIREAYHQLEEYFNQSRREFQLPIRLIGTPFRIKVWNELLAIPYGKTTSYHDIAIRIGNPKANRAVGGAIHHNPIGIIVPCHRVIGANGDLVGFAGGLELKQQLLELEQSAR